MPPHPIDQKAHRLVRAAEAVSLDIWACIRPGNDPVDTDLGRWLGVGVKVDHYQELRAALDDITRE